MKTLNNYFFTTCLTLIFTVNIYFAQAIISDHNCTNLGDIPESAIVQAKNDLHIAYGHTSHGSQLITGMNNLDDFMGGNNLYVWHDGPLDGYLDIDDYFVSGDLGHNGDTTWASKTREYLDDPANADVNVVIWSWCGGVSDNTEEGIQIYLDKMTQLERDYPHVKFVYMTGHSDGTNESGNLHIRNQQIRDYCVANDKILYDFYDIELYNPDKDYFGNKRVNDYCDYDSDNDGSRDRNWALDWQNSHTQDVDWYDCSCAHSQALNCNQKAYTAWWLWARLAGWDGTPVPVELTTFSATVNNNQVILKWETATEVNNYGFSIERIRQSANSSIRNSQSANSQSTNSTWQEIGFVEGYGNSNSPKSYSFLDEPDAVSGKYFYRLKQIDLDGNFEYSSTVEANFTTPIKYLLQQNYPNPFNPATTISYSIPENTNVEITIYNTLGKLVKTLINKNQAAGNYSVTWNGEDQFGNQVSSGNYIYRLKTNNFIQTRQMLLIK